VEPVYEKQLGSKFKEEVVFVGPEIMRGRDGGGWKFEGVYGS
jgi:hypothetical protein